MDKRNILSIIFLFFILTDLGCLAGSQMLDPDFGWHWRTGFLILERGVPKIDWYSYTMPNFPWIDHEWLTDILIYKICSFGGIPVTLLFFIILVSLAFLIIGTRPIFELKNWTCPYFIPVLMGYWACLGFLGIRPQLFTILFFAILWKALRDFLNSRSRLIYLSPLLFIIWTNLHGGFPVGLLLLFLVFMAELFKKLMKSYLLHQILKEQPMRKILILLALLILSSLATLINPYGLRIYEEIFRTMGDQFLRFHIAEWLPLFFTSSLPVLAILYLGSFLGLLIIFRRKVDFTELVLLLVFSVFAFSSQRHFPIFVILSIPIFARFISYFREAIDPAALKLLLAPRLAKPVLVMAGGLTLLGVLGALAIGIHPNPAPIVYPQKAIPFLKTLPDRQAGLPLSENLLNEYKWGGYLIWQLPERKVFIDGRMPSWRENGEFVFGDYVKIMDAEDGFQGLLDKYKIQLVLLDRNKKTEFEKKQKMESSGQNPCLIGRQACLPVGMAWWKDKLLQFLIKHERFSKSLGIHLADKNIYQELLGLGWQVIYEDETAVILRAL